MGRPRRWNALAPWRVAVVVLLVGGACGKVKETQEPDEAAPVGAGGAGGANQGVGGLPHPTVRNLPDLDCATQQYVCDAYDPPAGCLCDESRPVDSSQCDEPYQYWCREHSPELSCVCDDGATSRCEAGVRRFLALGFASTICVCDGAGGMGGQGAADDPQRPLCVVPLGAWETPPTELPWAPEPWVEPNLDSCPAPYREPASPQRFELMGLDACACQEAGGEPLVAHFREGGARYAGCAAELPVPALRREPGWCITLIEDREWVARPRCALVSTDRAPSGWTFVPCGACE